MQLITAAVGDSSAVLLTRTARAGTGAGAAAEHVTLVPEHTPNSLEEHLRLRAYPGLRFVYDCSEEVSIFAEVDGEVVPDESAARRADALQVTHSPRGAPRRRVRADEASATSAGGDQERAGRPMLSAVGARREDLRATYAARAAATWRLRASVH